MRRSILGGRFIWNRVSFSTRPFCSTGHRTTNSNPPTIAGNGTESSSSSSSSLSQYSEQYKALNNLDFMAAAKILFTDQPKKKKFGLDFHLVQLFLACLPPLAVYLVAQYARSEMRRMDAELELRKQAEFEAQTKELELKKAQEREADPVLKEVKERLNKLEETVKEIVVESKKQSQTEANDAGKSSVASVPTSNEGKLSEAATTTPSSQYKQKSGESKKDLS